MRCRERLEIEDFVKSRWWGLGVALAPRDLERAAVQDLFHVGERDAGLGHANHGEVEHVRGLLRDVVRILRLRELLRLLDLYHLQHIAIPIFVALCQQRFRTFSSSKGLRLL